jgi:putative ABC transport system permease protein
LVDQVSAFGTDIIQVEVKTPKVSKTSAANAGSMVGGTQITTLKLDDAKKIAKLSNVKSWYAMLMSQQVVAYQNKDKQEFILGTTAEVAQSDKQMQIEAGQMFTEEDDSGLAQAAVLGAKAKEYFFGDADAIGQTVKIKGQTFHVVGVLKSRGVAGFFDFDSTIYIPIQTLQKKILGIDHIQSALFQLKDMGRLEETILDVTDIMRDRHNITEPDDDDFAVNSIAEVQDILDKVFFAINALLLGLVSISLLVGGVGIMNVMYVSVTERTFEIGLKKSIGARNSSILLQFLFEAIFMTALGGILGIFVGIGISKIAELLAGNYGFPIKFTVTWLSSAIGFGFSAIVGITFGYYPAKTASKLTPMDAIRKE